MMVHQITQDYDSAIQQRNGTSLSPIRGEQTHLDVPISPSRGSVIQPTSKLYVPFISTTQRFVQGGSQTSVPGPGSYFHYVPMNKTVVKLKRAAPHVS